MFQRKLLEEEYHKVLFLWFLYCSLKKNVIIKIVTNIIPLIEKQAPSIKYHSPFFISITQKIR